MKNVSVIVIAAFMTLLSGCSKDLPEGASDATRYNSVSLALSLKNTGETPKVQTKMTATITQDGSGFRGIEQVFMIPFQTVSASPVTAENSRLGTKNISLQSPGISNNGLVANNNSHLYDFASVPQRTNRVLAYGKAPDSGSVSDVRGKHRNGMLVPSRLDNPDASGDISFSLVTILGEDQTSEINQTADNLIAALNGVVEALQSANDPVLRSVLDVFAIENRISACSSQTFYRLEQNIFGMLFEYSGTDLESINALMPRLTALQTARNSAGDNFPASYGIPEGSIGIWWNGNRFVRLFTGVNISLVPVAEYSYPPSLWYYANSAIRTSSDDNIKAQYKPQNSTWSNILSYYLDGNTVSPATRSTALVEQLQYGVGLVEFRFVTPGADAAAAANCPLTGIIIEGQKEVDFSFSPKASPTIFMYDNTVSDVKLGGVNQYVQVLVLPTSENKVVHFALEFQNNTDSAFECQQGIIPNGCKFYLAGELKPGEGEQPAQEQITSVFSRDHKTTVYIKVNKLSSAYNTVPDLREPQLEIGIVADVDWVQVEPGGVQLPFD